ncbi:MAG: fumarylacetoacetate hydrolase [Sphingomonas bacterium]|nr:fumarylacetoacetate hydrolase [Sphingomonas bacterium]
MKIPETATAATLTVVGSDTPMAIRRIFCVGQNYAEHAREMGGDGRAPPFFFTKPADAIVPGGGDIAYPPRTSNFHYEVELVIAIGRGGADIPAAAARDHVLGIAVGVDLTRRDLQAEAKAAGLPWDMSKAFDRSAPCAPITVLAADRRLDSGAIRLAVNGTIRQQADIADMIWSVDEIIAELSTYVALAPGDLIFTGTPAGVGALERGDRVRAWIEGLPELEIEIV